MRIPASEADSAGKFRLPTEGEWHPAVLDSVEEKVARSTGNQGWELNWKCSEGKIRDTLWWTPKGQGIAAKKLLQFGGAVRDGDEIDILTIPELVGLRAEIFVAHKTSEYQGKTYTNAEPDFSMTDDSAGAWFGYRAAADAQATASGEDMPHVPPYVPEDYPF